MVIVFMPHGIQDGEINGQEAAVVRGTVECQGAAVWTVQPRAEAEAIPTCEPWELDNSASS